MISLSSDKTKVSSNYWIVNLVCIWISQLLVMAGFSALVPFIPLFITGTLGVTNQEDVARAIAFFNFFGTMAYAIFCPIWGKLSDRFGVKPMLLRGTFVTCFIFPAMGYVVPLAKFLSPAFPFVSAVGLLIFLRFLSAACAGTTAASQVMIVRTVPDHRQGFALGSMTTAFWGGAMLGNVIGGLVIHKYGYLVSFWLCGAMYLIAGFAVLFTRDNPVRLNPTKSRMNRQGVNRFIPVFTRAVWIMFALFLLMGLVRSIEAPYIAIKIKELAGETEAAYWTGIVSAFVACAAVVSGLWVGYLSDRYPPLKILIPVVLVSIIALFLQGIAHNLVLFTIGRSLLYAAAGGLHPILQKTLSTVTPKRKRGSIFGVSTCLNCCGIMLAALVGGWIYAKTTISTVFYGTALAYLISLPLLIRGIRFATRRPKFQRQR